MIRLHSLPRDFAETARGFLERMAGARLEPSHPEIANLAALLSRTVNDARLSLRSETAMPEPTCWDCGEKATMPPYCWDCQKAEIEEVGGAEGREKERAAIVAYLRRMPQGVLHDTADEIEQGEHVESDVKSTETQEKSE